MFYVGNKKVKEVVVKGYDNFLHRVRAGVLNSKYFYLTNPQNSELVDVVVNYSGERTRTSPQMVKKSELSSTTIRLNDISSQYELMVSASSPGYDCVDSFSNTSKTLKLKSTTTKSTVTLYLIKKDNMISTNSVALNIDSDPLASSSYGSFALENACAYVTDSSGCHQLTTVDEIWVSHNKDYIEFYPMLDPAITGTNLPTHFGFLSKSKAEALGFSATENPDGSSKACSDYYGWGCWTDSAWLWSDVELQELFSTGDDIRVSDTWQEILPIGGNIFHWGIYNLDLSSLDPIGSTEVFIKAWIVAKKSDDTTQIYDVSGMSFDAIYSDIFQVDEFSDAQLVVPYSQSCGETYQLLQNRSIIELQQDIVDSYFGTSNGISIDTKITGDYQFSLAQNNNQYPYVYAGDFSNTVLPTFYDQGGYLTGPTTYSVSNGVLYIGATYPEATSLDITTVTTVDTAVLGAVSLGYKLIPLITSSGPTQTNGMIEIVD